jgi:hypothetical protein
MTQNCDDGSPSRKIVCLAGEKNTCLIHCGIDCSKYEPKVKSYQRTTPQNAHITLSNTAVSISTPSDRTMRMPLGNSPLNATISTRATQAWQQASDYRERMAALPNGKCGNCGGGNTAAMR